MVFVGGLDGGQLGVVIHKRHPAGLRKGAREGFGGRDPEGGSGLVEDGPPDPKHEGGGFPDLRGHDCGVIGDGGVCER